eukprot:5433601-Amphidinium_carterae.2
MPAPKPDATHVPVENTEERWLYTVGEIVNMPTSQEGDLPQLQVPEDSQGAGSSGSMGASGSVPQQLTAVVPGQSRVRGDQEIDMATPHPGTMLQSWCTTPLASLGRRRKRVFEQPQQDVPVVEESERNLDKRSVRDSEERGSMSSEAQSHLDALGTSTSNKIPPSAQQDDNHAEKRIRVALSLERRRLDMDTAQLDAPDVPEPAPTKAMPVPAAQIQVTPVTPVTVPPQNMSGHHQPHAQLDPA